MSLYTILAIIYSAEVLWKNKLVDPFGAGYQNSTLVLAILAGSSVINFTSFFFYLNNLDLEILLYFLPVPISFYYIKKWIQLRNKDISVEERKVPKNFTRILLIPYYIGLLIYFVNGFYFLFQQILLYI